MSGIADEMARRVAEDGGAGLLHPDPPAGGAPGSGGVQDPPPAQQPAGASNTDNDAGGGTPEAIPYARFKEVNDRLGELKGYEQLRQYGYDPDSLGRLAAFEAQYFQDPVGTVKQMVDNLDLPQELKDAFAKHTAGGGDPGSAEGTTDDQTQKPLELPPEVKESVEYVKKLRERDEENDRNQRLDSVVSIWTEMDKQDQIETPEQIKLMAIAATAASGVVFPTQQALAEAARSTVVNYRSSVLSGAVQGTGRGGPPPALPSGPPVASGPINFGGDMRAASKAAELAIKNGQLPQ